ncbi:MAG: DUF4270 domain-containing protein [Bacteroidetes bacterium]|nr:DUF4270 domain-containing protein [Bacteroidota bacterium]
MKKNISKIFSTSAMVIGSVFLLSCEPDADSLGEQFFVGNMAEGERKAYDLTAFNLNNNDTLRTDAVRLQNAAIGAFNEGVFGMQKSAFVSQVRLDSYNPNFGGNPIADSAVMVLKPLYAADSITTTTDENFVFHDGNVPAKKVVSSFPVLKYGKTKIGGKTIFNIKVHEVDEFLYGNADPVYSNKIVAYNALLGSKVFDGTVNTIKITKKNEETSLWTSEDGNLRIPLSTSFFQTKIIDKKGQPELSDASNFIRYFKGIRLSVDENDGYIFRINPTNAQIVLYYKSDDVNNGVTTRTQKTLKFNLGSGNTQFSQIQYNRNSTMVQTALANINTTNGDPKLFLQGMGGPGAVIRIPSTAIADLKNKFLNEKVGIITAKIRMYSDETVWNNNYAKPTDFLFNTQNATTFMLDLDALATAPGFQQIKYYDIDKNPAYYDITITKTLKDIIEKDGANKDFVLNLGGFLKNSQTNSFFGVNYHDRAYKPNRLVVVGSDASNAKRIQLNVIYGKK